MYLREIREITFFSKKEQIELAKKKDKGDREARDLMIKSHLPLVVSIAKRYRESGVQFLDLIQMGNKGLIKAVEKFNYKKDCKLTTYAPYWIKQSIARGMRRCSTIIIPDTESEHISSMKKYIDWMNDALGRKPSIEELAEKMGVKEDVCIERMQQLRKFVSLDTPDDDPDLTFHEYIENKNNFDIEDIVQKRLLRDLVDIILCNFEDRHSFVLNRLFGDYDNTLQEVGDILGCKRQNVLAMKKTALKYIKKTEAVEKLKKYY